MNVLLLLLLLLLFLFLISSKRSQNIIFEIILFSLMICGFMLEYEGIITKTYLFKYTENLTTKK